MNNLIQPKFWLWMRTSVVVAGESVLSAAATRLDRAGVPHATCLLGEHEIQDDIVTTIVAEANGWPADLIVMGSHGRSGARRMIMGSVASEVMAQTSLPVLLARQRSEPDDGQARSDVKE